MGALLLLEREGNKDRRQDVIGGGRIKTRRRGWGGDEPSTRDFEKRRGRVSKDGTERRPAQSAEGNNRRKDGS